MERLEKLVRPHILGLQPYSSARDDFKGTADVYIDANENAFGSVGLEDFNRYPDPHQNELKATLARLRSTDLQQIFIGNGSDEPIDLLIRAFCKPAVDEIMIMPPTYGMYKVSGEVNNVGVSAVPLTEELELDLLEINGLVSERTKIMFICSPNNPTGNLLEEDRIIELLNSFSGLVVVDEAYIDFAHRQSLISRINDYPNLVVLQTFSKAWGLAGLRLGAAFGHPFVIEVLNKIKPPYNVNAFTQKAGIKALKDQVSKKGMVESILSQRKDLESQLSEIASVKRVFSSSANFLLVRFDNAKAKYEALRNAGIIVRDRSKELYCEECLRITVGTPEENERLVEVLKEMS